MRKIAIANRKGGVGKTTTAVHIAAGLAIAGVRTLLVDTDSQAHCGRILGVDAGDSLDRALRGSKVDPVEARENLHLLAGSRAMGDFSTVQPERRFRREELLSEALAGIDYQYVILDTAPGFGDMSINALFYATDVLVPVSMEALSLDGLLTIQEEIAGINNYSELRILGIVPTFADGRVGKTVDIIRNLTETFGDLVTLPIRYSSGFSDLAFSGQTLYESDPHNRGAEDYAQLTAAIA